MYSILACFAAKITAEIEGWCDTCKCSHMQTNSFSIGFRHSICWFLLNSKDFAAFNRKHKKNSAAFVLKHKKNSLC